MQTDEILGVVLIVFIAVWLILREKIREDERKEYLRKKWMGK